MSHAPSTLLRFPGVPSLLTTTTLARWRLHKTWPFLCLTALGLLAAVVLICLAPFFTAVTTTAGLRDLLQADPQNAALSIDMNAEGLSTPLLYHLHQQLDTIVQQDVQPYLVPSAPPAITVSGYTFLSAPTYQYTISLLAYPLAQARTHLTLVQGTLPQPREHNGALDVLLTPEAADLLHLSVGNDLPLKFIYTRHSTSPISADSGTERFLTTILKFHLSGLFRPDPHQSLFWQQQSFLPGNPQNSQEQAECGLRCSLQFSFLTADTALLSQLDRLAAADGGDAVHYPQSSFLVHSLYQLATQKINAQQLNDLLGRLGALQSDLANKYGDIQNQNDSLPNLPPTYPYLEKTLVNAPLFSSIDGPGLLTLYQNRLAVVTVPVLLLTLQIVALVLYFVSMMTDLLVERQSEAISVMRSRGASRGQIFGALAFQCLALCLLALLLGPLLALGLTTVLGYAVLTPGETGAIWSLTSQPLQTLGDTALYAGGTLLVACLAMAMTLWRALAMDVLTTRRAASRSIHRPLWLRLNLDLIAGVLALLIYLLSLYLTSLNSFLDPRSRTLVTVPLTLLAPLFLVLGCLLLFLRLFPFFLRFAAWLSLRGKGATSMLALAQMSRSPAQTVRMTMLLALATAFTLFTLVFTASQDQRATLLADYESGADFRGTIPANVQYLAPSEVSAAYRDIPGVTAASAGFVTVADASGSAVSATIDLRAVDGDTFAQTAFWPSFLSSHPLSSLFSQLVAQRSEVKRSGLVPVIIDQVLQERLNLQRGSTFNVDVNALPYGVLRCKVLAILPHLPTVNDDAGSSANDSYSAHAGLLFDYQSYALFYEQGTLGTALQSHILPINQVWLRTNSDPASLQSLRTALHGSRLRLEQLYDRRDLAQSLRSDPLYLDLVSILFAGITLALVLALVGNLLSSWLNARSRLTNFAVLRALGTSPRQVANVLSWEQVIIYLTSLLLGALLGMVLTLTIVPALLVSNLPTHGVLSLLSSDDFYALQHVLPAQLVFSPQLLMAMLLLVAICSLALGLMIRMISRPSLAQALRINED